MNGAQDSSTNGTQNGSTHEQVDTILSDAPACTPRGLDRRELVRIIVQAIDALGYQRSARALEDDAGVEAMSAQMRTLRDCVLLGRWTDLEKVLGQVTVFKSEDDARAARFVLYEQKFLELLEAGHTAEALECLRNDLTRLSPDPKLLHKLPLLCMCTTPHEVREHANWPGAGKVSRTALLEKLQEFIPASELLQENRLENLLCQTIEQQKRQTMFPYTRQNRVTLLEDMVHCKDRVPRLLHQLKGHFDEVWKVQFSHHGEYLASASKDDTIIIWKSRALLNGDCEEDDVILHQLKGHTRMVTAVSWSPDDKWILSCGSDRDRAIRLWDVESGKCVRVFEKHTKDITACAWMPDGKSFVSGAHDSKILEWNAETGECIWNYMASAHVNDVAITEDGKRLIAICSDSVIQIFDTTMKEQIGALEESVSITSLFLSSDGEHLLVNTKSDHDPERRAPEIHMWNFRTMERKQTYRGFKQTRYVISGCFGGHNQMLVVCGSEDNLVYIWERSSGKLIAQLSGHVGTVNTVAFCEANENVFASGSDDHSVIIWGVPDSR